ncbi:MAG: succinylglutamate desuccinylase/aspartoacylase family protein [archaeon]
MKIAIVVCVHGDEIKGLKVAEMLKDHNPPVSLFIANSKAVASKFRFIDTDLNRCFPGNEEGNHEEIIAYELSKTLKDFDYVIDIHTTTAITEPFIIATRKTKNISRLISAVPLKKGVFMSPIMADGKALIDHCEGISLEFNEKCSPSEVKNIIEHTINNLGSNKDMEEKQEYLVYDILKESRKKFSNFSRTMYDGEEFYPILYGTKAYKNICCLKARRIK